MGRKLGAKQNAKERSLERERDDERRDDEGARRNKEDTWTKERIDFLFMRLSSENAVGVNGGLSTSCNLEDSRDTGIATRARRASLSREATMRRRQL